MLRKSLLSVVAIGMLAACATGSGDPVQDAVAAMEQQDYRAARIHLMTALREDGQDSEANLLFARTMIELGDGLAADTALRKLEGKEQYAQQIVPLLGKMYLLNGRNEEALGLAASPAGKFAVELHAVKVIALFSLGRVEDAEVALAAALAEHPDEAELLWIQGNRALELGNIDEADRSAGRALAARPDSMEALMLTGRLELAKANGDKALEYFERVRKLRPDNVAAEYLRGTIYMDRSQRSKARQSFETVLATSPMHPWATYFLAQIDHDEGKSDAAFDRLQSFKGEFADVPQALRLGGLLDLRRGNFEQAIDKLNRYVSRNQPDAAVLVALSKALAGAGNDGDAYQAVAALAGSATAPADALDHAAKMAAAAGSSSAREYRERAEALGRDASKDAIFEAEHAIIGQQWGKAAAIYEKLLRTDHPQKVMLLNNVAMVQLNLANGDKAMKLARQAQRLAPDDPMVKDTLGWILLQTRADKAGALELLTEAAAAAPRNPEIQWHLANALAANGKRDEARKLAVNLQRIAGGEQRQQIKNLLAWI